MTSKVHSIDRAQHLRSLLIACGEQQQSALADLYKLTSASLFGILVRILGVEAVAEEALQETFVKIWRNARSYSSELGSPMAWMTSIARYQALDILRKRKSREDNENPQMITLIDNTADTKRSFSDISDNAQSLLLCLDELEPSARDCIVKAYCEGYSHAELCAQHNAPLGTVKSWIRRGLTALRSCINDYS